MKRTRHTTEQIIKKLRRERPMGVRLRRRKSHIALLPAARRMVGLGGGCYKPSWADWKNDANRLGS